jgi:hypothetical protein
MKLQWAAQRLAHELAGEEADIAELLEEALKTMTHFWPPSETIGVSDDTILQAWRGAILKKVRAQLIIIYGRPGWFCGRPQMAKATGRDQKSIVYAHAHQKCRLFPPPSG